MNWFGKMMGQRAGGSNDAAMRRWLGSMNHDAYETEGAPDEMFQDEPAGDEHLYPDPVGKIDDAKLQDLLRFYSRFEMNRPSTAPPMTLPRNEQGINWGASEGESGGNPLAKLLGMFGGGGR
jgi:hypothetical protein